VRLQAVLNKDRPRVQHRNTQVADLPSPTVNDWQNAMC
jgi:hypothetical protein